MGVLLSALKRFWFPFVRQDCIIKGLFMSQSSIFSREKKKRKKKEKEKVKMR